MVVNGFVCTKNIAHKKVMSLLSSSMYSCCYPACAYCCVFLQMNASIKSPKILLLKCSIEYLYREETKFTSIDPIVLQVRHRKSNLDRNMFHLDHGWGYIATFGCVIPGCDHSHTCRFSTCIMGLGHVSISAHSFFCYVLVRESCDVV